ncbi:glutamate racemase [Amphritea sp.]|uniref:glutamate racemase n=1 Tax=Amphritea sp. TaxID=1872502 RepID=UPI0025B9109C|nr:glutamate racemase [Amphritea sp.]
MERPIGIFDSGVGGISIARAIRAELPSENLIYVADQAFSPYGSQSQDVIEDRAETVSQFLSNQNCKAIVVACNTATVNSIEILRSKFKIPVIGVEPGIKPAVMQSKAGIIGVLATEQTLNSRSFQQLQARFSDQAKIVVQACPRFVELVEEGDLNSPETFKVVERYVMPLLDKGADQIVLGCTHYPFLKPVIEYVLQDRADIIDTALPVAAQVKRKLSELNLLNPQDDPGSFNVWSSNTSDNISGSVSLLLGHEVTVSIIPHL